MELTIKKSLMIEELKELIKSSEKINLSALERKWNITRKTILKYKNIILRNSKIEYKQLKRKYDKPKTSFLEKHKDFLDERIKNFENDLSDSKPSILALYQVFINYIAKK